MAGQSYSNKMPFESSSKLTLQVCTARKKLSVVAFCESDGDVRRGPAAWCWAGRGT